MSEDIFEFWSPSRIKKDAHWHPDDETVFNRKPPHRFEMGCLPIAFFGPLEKAPVVLLFLSPGFSDFDVKHAGENEGQDGYARQRTGEADMWSEADHPPAWQWWTKIVRQFGAEPENAKGKNSRPQHRRVSLEEVSRPPHAGSAAVKPRRAQLRAVRPVSRRRA